MPTPTEPARLTVAILVRDDAEALQETLQNVRSWSDQMLVLDTGSADDSLDVARRLGADVHSHVWQDDFSAARNACWPLIQGQWVLWLDAGETLSEEDASQLVEFVRSGADAEPVYALAIRVEPQTAQAAAEQIARVRLTALREGLRFDGRVRESLVHAAHPQGLRVEGLPFIIRRGLREHDADRKAARAHRNIRLANCEIKERGPSPHLLNCLGDAFQTLNDNDRAAQFFQHALKASAPGSLDMLEAYYGLLTSLDGRPECRQVQLDLAVQAIEAFPLDSQLLCALGGYLQAMGRTDLAQQSYRTAVQFGQISPTVWHVAEVREIAVICLSITQQILNQLDDAEQTMRSGLESVADSVRLRRHLIELLVKRGKGEEALHEARQLPREMPHREAFRSAVRGACLAADKNWIAARAYLKTAYQAGCRDSFCLRWYGLTLCAMGERHEALQIAEAWRLVDPQHPELLKMLESLDPAADGTGPPRQLRVDAAGGPSSLGAASHAPGQQVTSRRLGERSHRDA